MQTAKKGVQIVHNQLDICSTYSINIYVDSDVKPLKVIDILSLWTHAEIWTIPSVGFELLIWLYYYSNWY